MSPLAASCCPRLSSAASSSGLSSGVGALTAGSGGGGGAGVAAGAGAGESGATGASEALARGAATGGEGSASATCWGGSLASSATIGGSAMTVEGLQSLFPMDELSLIGLVEVLPHLIGLARRLSQTVAAIRAMRPQAVVTIDAERDVPVGSPEDQGRGGRVRLERRRQVHHLERSGWLELGRQARQQPGHAREIEGHESPTPDPSPS